MIDQWRKFLHLSPSERALLIIAAVLLPITALALRVAGFRRWQAALSNFSPGVEMLPAGDTLEQARRTARIVSIASRHGFYRANCLQQSLVLWFLLRRQGVESELRIGVRTNANLCEAHAWVERMGQVLNDTEDVSYRFKPFNFAVVSARKRTQPS
jgi:hypothetical protein